MASVPGGQYTLFANGNNMNVVATPDGVGMPPPLAGLFNLELLTSGSGSSSVYNATKDHINAVLGIDFLSI